MVWQMSDRRKKVIQPGEPGVLTDALRREIAEVQKRYPTQQAALLPAMLAVQRQVGYISSKAIVELADLLELSAASVLDALSFYSHLFREPVGRHVVVVCRGLSCELCGAAELLSALKRKLSIAEHGTTGDKRFTLIAEECLGACERAPYLLIDEDAYGPVRAEDLDSILSQYK
jgi:NADH-quinone oxidoreductase subunit E